MEKHSVLILDRDCFAGCDLQNIFHKYGFEAWWTDSTSKALEIFTSRSLCLVIMDVHLGDVDGRNLIEMMKSTKNTPILVVSHFQEREMVHTLRAGVDVCLPKPVDRDICAAQAFSLMRLYETTRHPEDYGIPLSLGTDMTIDPTCHRAFADGRVLDLTRLEFKALYYLADNRHVLLRYDQIYSRIWGPGPVSMYAVRKCIKGLRKKLLHVRNVSIRNVRGIGYQFIYEE